MDLLTKDLLTKEEYENFISSYKIVGSKKAALTRAIKDLNEKLGDMRDIQIRGLRYGTGVSRRFAYYLGDKFTDQTIIDYENNIMMIIELRASL